jgi:hypothetical protein
MAGAAAFIFGSMLGGRGSTTETQTNVQDQLAERVEYNQLELMIGKSNIMFLHRNEGIKFKFTNKLTNKPMQAMRNAGEYFVNAGAMGFESRTTTRQDPLGLW